MFENLQAYLPTVPTYMVLYQCISFHVLAEVIKKTKYRIAGHLGGTRKIMDMRYVTSATGYVFIAKTESEKTELN